MEFRKDVLSRCEVRDGKYDLSAAIISAIVKEETGLDNTQEVIDYLVSVNNISRYNLSLEDAVLLIDFVSELAKSHKKYGSEEKAKDGDMFELMIAIGTATALRNEEAVKMIDSMTRIIIALFGSIADAHSIEDTKYLFDGYRNLYKIKTNI